MLRRFIFRLPAILCARAGATIALAVPPVGAEPLRIMPIGDCLTEGGDWRGGWRRPLVERRALVLGNPNFVGSRSSRHTAPADLPGHDDGACCARRIEQIANRGGLRDALAQQPRNPVRGRADVVRIADLSAVRTHAGRAPATCREIGILGAPAVSSR